jgi:GNAT superfamily N-acetyltransferase
MQNVEIREVPIDEISELARIPIAFSVERVYDVHLVDARAAEGRGRIQLSERPIDVPYMKDYDRIEGEGPLHWADRHDIRYWGFLQARSSERLVGGAVVAFGTSTLPLLEGRSDLAALWDIRVAPDMRDRGIGATLFRAAVDWACTHHCVELRAETQNVNVAACRFYQRQGCVLSSVCSGAYPSLPDEVQLVWSKVLRH